MEAYTHWILSNPLLKQPDKTKRLKELQENIQTPFRVKTE